MLTLGHRPPIMHTWLAFLTSVSPLTLPLLRSTHSRFMDALKSVHCIRWWCRWCITYDVSQWITSISLLSVEIYVWSRDNRSRTCKFHDRTYRSPRTFPSQNIPQSTGLINVHLNTYWNWFRNLEQSEWRINAKLSTRFIVPKVLYSTIK